MILSFLENIHEKILKFDRIHKKKHIYLYFLTENFFF
jgi:hypothetical protein